MAQTTDENLVSMLKDPSLRDKGFLQLMETYKEPVYWHIRRLVVSHEDAEDILQETFIQVYRFAGSFRGECKVFTWIYRIATNECITHFRKNKKRFNHSNGADHKRAVELCETDPEKSETILFKFQQAIQQLTERQKIIFNLRYYDEMSYEDIGQILHSSVNTLKTNYHYASEKIKQYLIDHA